MGRGRPQRPLKRTAGQRPELRTVVVFSEGLKSEPDYLKGLIRLPPITDRTSVKIEVDPRSGSPNSLVRRAVRRKRDPEVDECWCIFDVEWPQNHPDLAEAIQLAERSGVGLAISNPCFEIWLIWHFTDRSCFTDTPTAVRESRRLDGRQGKDKSIDASKYLPHRGEAVRRSRAADQRHAHDSTSFPHDNPSSGFYKFLLAVEPTEDS